MLQYLRRKQALGSLGGGRAEEGKLLFWAGLLCYNNAMEKTLTPKRPLIIAHRGASALAPENTLAAFQLALDLGADGIELDVMLTVDGQLAVIHDSTLERTTNGSGKVVRFSLAELQALDAGSKFDPRFQNEMIPSLDQVFEALGGRLLINVELKNYSSPLDRLTETVIDCIARHGLSDGILISSFNPINLSKAARLAPRIPRGLLTEPGKSGRLLRGWLGRRFNYDALHPYYADVDPEMLAYQHARGKQVNVWTVDAAEDLLAMRGLGVDMIITNDPAHARQVLEA